jgi:hypothetical protein
VAAVLQVAVKIQAAAVQVVKVAFMAVAVVVLHGVRQEQV